MADATISLFSEFPSSVIIESLSDFNGSALSGTPTKGGGFTYSNQAGGGLLEFLLPTKILQISYRGGGTLTIVQVVGSHEITLGTISNAGIFTVPVVFAKGQKLKLTSAGATLPAVVITGQLMVV